MSSLVLSREGAALWLALLVGTHTDRDWVLRLFQNDFTPSKTDDKDSFTEASGGGYASLPLVQGSNWTITEGDVDDKSVALYLEQEFSFNADIGTIFGYYITENTTDVYIFGERLENPEETYDTKDIFVTPRLPMDSIAE